MLLIEGSDPRFPTLYRRWLARADQADIALTRLRIATLRLETRDLARVRKIRIVLAELSTAAWEAETHRALLNPGRSPPLRRIIEMLREGRLQVRSAPLAGWAPDFTVFHRRSGPDASSTRALLGPHWLEPASGLDGPRFAMATRGSDARRVAECFETIWGRAYEAGPAVARLLGATMEALDRLTPPGQIGIVSAPRQREILPP